MNLDENQQQQINIAEIQRNAARDYFEIKHSSSIKYFLATSPEAELDMLAEANESLFRHRFGITVNQVIRIKIIALKNEYHLTDRETTALLRSGQIRYHGQEVMIAPDKITPLIGGVFIGFLSVLMTLCLLHVGHSTVTNSLYTLIGIILPFTFWLGAIAMIKKHMIAPWRTLKQSGIVRNLPEISYVDSLLLRTYPANISNAC